MKLKINRKNWLRGEGGPESNLLRSKDQKMCCLGFYALGLGQTEKEIEGIPEPEIWREEFPDWTRSDQASVFSDEIQSLIDINDDPSMPDKEREKQIKEIFARNGVEVEFV